MDCLRQGVALNHEGVKLYKARDFSASATVFQRSAAMLRAFGEDPLPFDRGNEGVEGNLRSSLLYFDGSLSMAANKDSDLHEDFYLQTAPLEIEAVPINLKMMTKDVHEILLAATCSTLFNLALSWHMQGLEISTLAREYFPWTKAAKLYDLVLSMLKDIGHDSERHHAPLSAMIACLVLNNRAHLAMQQESDYVSSTSCARHMSPLLASFGPLDMFLVLGINVVDELVLNCMRLLSVSTASAA